jgi:hypothetical protein
MDRGRQEQEAMMRRWLARLAGGSRVLSAARRVCAGSLVCAGLAAMARPSLAYLGGAQAPETGEQAREAIARLWQAVRESVIGRSARRVEPIAARVWQDSAPARACAGWNGLSAVDRLRIVGLSGLAAALAASLLKLFSREPWPPLSILVWVATIALAALVAARPREFHSAWTASRLRHSLNGRE